MYVYIYIYIYVIVIYVSPLRVLYPDTTHEGANRQTGSVSFYSGKYKCMFYRGCTLAHILSLLAPLICPCSVL